MVHWPGGDRKATVKDRKKEIGKGLLAKMLADVGIVYFSRSCCSCSCLKIAELRRRPHLSLRAVICWQLCAETRSRRQLVQ